MHVMGLATLNNNRHYIDTMRNRELDAYLDNGDCEIEHCVHCCEPIGQYDTHYLIDDEYYCHRCENIARDRIDGFVADLLGYHVSDEALDAIMADCERDRY